MTARTLCLSLIILLLSLSLHASAEVDNQLFPVQHGNKWGFINHAGTLVIPYQFDNVRGFSEGLALATLSRKKLFIDVTGRIVFEAKFEAWPR